MFYVGNIFKEIYFHQITKYLLVITFNDKLLLMKFFIKYLFSKLETLVS